MQVHPHFFRNKEKTKPNTFTLARNPYLYESQNIQSFLQHHRTVHLHEPAFTNKNKNKN